MLRTFPAWRLVSSLSVLHQVTPWCPFKSIRSSLADSASALAPQTWTAVTAGPFLVESRSSRNSRFLPRPKGPKASCGLQNGRFGVIGRRYGSCYPCDELAACLGPHLIPFNYVNYQCVRPSLLFGVCLSVYLQVSCLQTFTDPLCCPPLLFLRYSASFQQDDSSLSAWP